MISVLIPVYNYNIKPLVDSLLLQFQEVDYKWEIVLSDDNSEKKLRELNFNFIKDLGKKNVVLFQQERNVGNSENRNILLSKASHSWLLFLDADVLAVHDSFIASYIAEMKRTKKDIIAGNIVYDSKKPTPNLLRWKYGKLKEEVSFDVRKKKPVLHVRGANFAIRKALIEKFKFPKLYEKYGFVDTSFFLQFNEKQISVIDNPVYHLGIEENPIYLNKTKNAVNNALFLLDNNEELASNISIVAFYKKVRFCKKLIANIYSKSHVKFENNLLSNKPSITIFQFYKLLYLGYLDFSKDIK